MREAAGNTIPVPQEFHMDGRRFLQYGISPVKIAALKRIYQGQGTSEDPVIRDGIEYVYNSKGKLVKLERVDKKTIEHNSILNDSAPTLDQIKKSPR